MNKKITAVTLTALMVLTMFTALVPAASAVKPVQVSAPYEFFAAVEDLSVASVDFNLTSKDDPSILYYDFDEGEGAEILNFTVDTVEQEITDTSFLYSTSIYYKDNDTSESWIAWIGEPYFVVENGSDWYLSKLLVDEEEDDDKLLRVGEILTLPNGFAVTPMEIDVDGGEAWFSVTQDGEEVDSTIAYENDTFAYETDLNESTDDDNWVLRFNVETVFAGMNTNLVKINSLQLLDPDVLKIDTPDDDTFTDFDVRSKNNDMSLEIERENDEEIDLKEDGIVSFLGDRFNFRINEDGNQGGIVIIITEPGTYELFAVVEDLSAALVNFNLTSKDDPSILYYDFDEGEGAEILNFTVDTVEQEITDTSFLYSTSIYYKDNDTSESWIAWIGEPYFVVENGSDWYLSKLLVDEEEDDDKLLRVGEILTLPNGFAVTPMEIDVDGGEAWFSVTQDGEEVDSTIAYENDTFAYETDLNESTDDDNWVLRFNVETVFAGMNTNLVKINSLQLLDPDVLKIDTPDDDTFTDFDVRSKNNDMSLEIERENDEEIDLKEDGIVSFLGDRFNFRINEDGDQGGVVMVIEVGGGAAVTETATTTVTETATAIAIVDDNATADDNATVDEPAAPIADEDQTEVPTPEPTKEPGFEAVFAVAGLLAVAYLVLRQRE